MQFTVLRGISGSLKCDAGSWPETPSIGQSSRCISLEGYRECFCSAFAFACLGDLDTPRLMISIHGMFSPTRSLQQTDASPSNTRSQAAPTTLDTKHTKNASNASYIYNRNENPYPTRINPDPIAVPSKHRQVRPFRR